MEVDLFLNHRREEVFRTGERVKAVSGQEFEIGDRLDSGGNAVVHKATEVVTGDEFAIKFQLTLSQRRMSRFRREIELLQQVRHEQLIGYVDQGEALAILSRRGLKGQKAERREVRIAFLIMPLAESNLTNALQRDNGRVSYEEYIGQFKGLARALSKLHEKAVHRDIKPENILVKGETWMLSDFGLCKFHENGGELTEADEPVGPRFWMSPEAVNRAVGNGDVISKSSDVFQLCSIFWFVVTGRHPTGCVCAQDWHGPDRIFQVVFDALSHDEDKRPMDGSKLVELLDRATLPAGAS